MGLKDTLPYLSLQMFLFLPLFSFNLVGNRLRPSGDKYNIGVCGNERKGMSTPLECIVELLEVNGARSSTSQTTCGRGCARPRACTKKPNIGLIINVLGKRLVKIAIRSVRHGSQQVKKHPNVGLQGYGDERRLVAVQVTTEE